MESYTIPDEQREVQDVLERFGKTHVEDILRKPYVKLALNKLRWVPIAMGISHYLLPDMPIMDYIQMANSMEERITRDSELDETAYYRIIAARNILVLLNMACAFNHTIQDFFFLTIHQIQELIRNCDFVKTTNLTNIFDRFSLKECDSIQKMVDAILYHIKPITALSEDKSVICVHLMRGTDTEQDILLGFELYHLFFSLLFAKRFPITFSDEHLNLKYHTQQFWDDYDKEFIHAVRTFDEGVE